MLLSLSGEPIQELHIKILIDKSAILGMMYCEQLSEHIARSVDHV